VYIAAQDESRGAGIKREHGELKRKYDAVQDSYTHLHNLFETIRSCSETDARAILNELRRGDAVEDVARRISAGDLLLQMSVVPETRYRYNFPWKVQMPTFLQRPDNPYLDVQIFEGSLGLGSNSSRASSQADSTLPYLKPVAAAKIVDTRLDTIKPSRYTNACNDDVLMRKLLHNFFLHEYSWITCFHKDDFLDDMLSEKTDFCSPLLVNAVLAFASVRVSNIHHNR
jgi:hypothetical protein